ncbi:MAG: DUF3102 domain-containing protein [Solirubrobacteraceae bacterium]
MTVVATGLAGEIRAEHEAAQAAFGAAVGHAIRAGQLLTEAKAQVPHGEWIPWLEENFPAGKRTAQGYMRLAANAEEAQALAHLGIEGALRQLAAPRPAATVDADPQEEPGSGIADVVAARDVLGADALTALDVWTQIHRRLPRDEAEVAEIESVCKVFGVYPIIERLTGEIPFVCIGYITGDGEHGGEIILHPGWLEYCRLLGGAIANGPLAEYAAAEPGPAVAERIKAAAS